MKNKLYLFPTTSPSWDKVADYERQTTLALSKKNWVLIIFFDQNITFKTLFINILKGKKERVFTIKNKLIKLRPLFFLPFPRIKFIYQLNLFLIKYQIKFLIFYLSLIKNLYFDQKIIWISHPLLYPFLKYLNKVDILYDMVDFYFSQDEKLNKKIQDYDHLLCQESKWIFANSQTLKTKKKQKYKNKNILLVPQGFRLNTFRKPKRISLSLKKRLKKISPPIVGYIGEISHRLDFKLLLNLVKKNHNLNFIFVGPKMKNSQEDKITQTQLKTQQLLSLPNVYYLNKQKSQYIPNILKYFTIGLIPYDIDHKFNYYCYPMKIFEYFYQGRPVISTPIVELKKLQPFIKIAKTTKDFEKEIKKILKNGWPEKYKKEQKKLAIENSWQSKVEKISHLLIK